MNVAQKETLSITVEGDEVKILKSAIKSVADTCKTVGFQKYGLNEKEATLISEINKQIIK